MQSLPATPPPVFLLARRPVFDVELRVSAYRLIHPEEGRTCASRAPSALSTEVLSLALIEFGLERLCQDGPAIVTVPTARLMDGEPLEIPRHRVVIRIRAGDLVTPEVEDRLRRLNGDGYRVVLGLDQLLARPELVDVPYLVEVDGDAVGPRLLRDQLAALPTTSPSSGVRVSVPRILATGVSSFERLQALKAEGVTHFEGDFLSRPQLVRTKVRGGFQSSRLQLLGRLNDPAVTLGELSDLVVRDATLSFRVLKWVNSAAVALPQRIESVPQALMLLGRTRLQRLLSLIALTEVQNKPEELLRSCLVRARCCELVAEMLGHREPSSLFTVGLFSLVGALLDMEMTDVVRALPLSRAVEAALLGTPGSEGRILDAVVAHERADFDAVGVAGVDPALLGAAFPDAVQWMRDTEACL